MLPLQVSFCRCCSATLEVAEYCDVIDFNRGRLGGWCHWTDTIKWPFCGRGFTKYLAQWPGHVEILANVTCTWTCYSARLWGVADGRELTMITTVGVYWPQLSSNYS
uniref:Uncharacterized protein n=1 Tax=Hyaloperonospora arabidopsidis (strain Emoy2) TaxID=559515 RepID=M4B5Q2_HYAAE